VRLLMQGPTTIRVDYWGRGCWLGIEIFNFRCDVEEAFCPQEEPIARSPKPLRDAQEFMKFRMRSSCAEAEIFGSAFCIEAERHGNSFKQS